ncbi:MAG: repressor LexA [Oscillospiraceae bacterium]|nr:repressor LexA [Oscillospiraceae bacterium]
MRTKNQALMEKIRAFAEEHILKTGASPSTSDIAEALGIARSTAYKYLSAMDNMGKISYRGGVIETGRTRLCESRTSRAAIVGSIPCGTPEEEEEAVEAYVALPDAIFGTGDFYILRASGDSMQGAGIDSGDLVVIERCSCAREGEIVVALVEGENTLKRYYVDREAGKIRLHAENPRYADIMASECEIQGVARHIIKAVV